MPRPSVSRQSAGAWRSRPGCPDICSMNVATLPATKWRTSGMALAVLMIGIMILFVQSIATARAFDRFSSFDQNIIWGGFDYEVRRMRNPQPHLCRLRCLNDSQCQAWQYIPPHGAPSARCALRSDMRARRPGGQGIVSGRLYNYDNRGMVNGRYAGRSYKVIRLTEPDPLQCRRRCAEDPQCRAWRFLKPGYKEENALCTLQSIRGHLQPDVESISGAKAIPPAGRQ